MGLTMKSNVNIKLDLLTNESIINDISWNQLTSINGDVNMCWGTNRETYMRLSKNHRWLNHNWNEQYSWKEAVEESLKV
jgi:hypothetical protein